MSPRGRKFLRGAGGAGLACAENWVWARIRELDYQI